MLGHNYITKYLRLLGKEHRPLHFDRFNLTYDHHCLTGPLVYINSLFSLISMICTLERWRKEPS